MVQDMSMIAAGYSPTCYHTGMSSRSDLLLTSKENGISIKRVPLSALRRPEEPVTYCFGTTSGLPEGTIMFCGYSAGEWRHSGSQAIRDGPHRSDFKTNHQAQL